MGGFMAGLLIGAGIEIVLGVLLGGVFHNIVSHQQAKANAASSVPSLHYYYG
jgi:hypothetical protein